MITAIFTTKKLEKTISKHITKDSIENTSFLGEWNANIFIINRKKCWLLMNFKTKYVLVLNDIKIKDVKNISTVFKENLYNQFIYDGIIIDYDLLDKMVGEVKLYSTNNNRKALGSINDYLRHYDYWVYEYETYDNMNFKDLTSRLNTNLPNTLLKYDYPKNEMLKLINSYTE